MVTIVAPELTPMYAGTRLDSALKSQKKFENLPAVDNIEWTLEHGFYANIGAFAIKVNLPSQKARTLENWDNKMVGDCGKHPMPPSAISKVATLDPAHSRGITPDDPKNLDGIELSQAGGETSQPSTVTHATSGKQPPRMKNGIVHLLISPLTCIYEIESIPLPDAASEDPKQVP